MRLYKLLFFFTLFCPVISAQQIKIGNYRFPDGGEYQGELFKGKPYGRGTTTYQNGDVHTGEYVKGKRQGHGTYLFADGEKYEGEWYQDQQHGQGTYYFSNNNIWIPGKTTFSPKNPKSIQRGITLQ